MEIKVLGTGCNKCKQLDKLVREVVQSEGIDAEVEKVEDIIDIMSYGIISTPALVINGDVVLRGYVPSADEIRKLISPK